MFSRMIKRFSVGLMASQLDIPYFLGLLYLMLQFQDEASLSFKLSKISVDSDSTSAIKFVKKQFHFSQKLQDSSSTELFKNTFSPPFTNVSLTARNYQSTPKPLLRTFLQPPLTVLFKTFSNYFGLIFFMVMFSVTTLRWKTFSKAKRKLKMCRESSMTHVFSTSKNVWGTLFVLLTLSDSGSSSSFTSSMTVSLNDTTVNTPWTSAESILHSLTPMPSSSSFDARFKSSQTSNQTAQNSLSKGENNILGVSSTSSSGSTGSPAAVSTVVDSSAYLRFSDWKTTLDLNPGNSLTSHSTSLTSVSSHVTDLNLESVVTSSSEAVETPILPSITLDTSFTTVSPYSTQLRLISTNVDNTFLVSSVSKEFFSSTLAFNEASSLLQRATDRSVSQIRSLFMEPQTNESPTHSVSGVTSSLGSSVASLTTSTTTISTSNYQEDGTTISTVNSTLSKLLSSLPPSTQSSSSTSLLSLTPPFLSPHKSSSTSITSFPLESSPPSTQFSLTSTIVVTIIANLPSLSSSPLSSELLVTSSSSSNPVNVYTPPLLSLTTASQASTSLSSLSSSSPSSVSSSKSPSLSLPPPLSLSPSSPKASPSPSLLLPSQLLLSSSSSSSSPSPPTSLRSPLPTPSPPSSSSIPPSSLLPSSPSSPPTSPSPSLSSFQTSLPSSPLWSLSLSSSPTSPSPLSSSSLPPSLSHSSLSSPSSSLQLASLTLPTLSPSATTLPSFSSPSLLTTSKAVGSTVLESSATPLTSSIFLSWSNSSQQQTWSSLESLMTVNLTSPITNQVMASVTLSEISQETLLSSATSSTAHISPTTSPQDGTRIINVTVSLINEEFHSDLLNESSAKFMNLSQRVKSTLWELFSQTVKDLKEIKILQFSQGSVKVDSELLFSSSSNVTAQVVNQTLLRGNGSNNNGFIFSKIVVKETCTPRYCMNSGSCQEGADGATCSCSTGFVGSRCAQESVAVNGNYTEWSEFTECSKTCDGGQRSRRRTCTNPPPQNGGKDCAGLGPVIEHANCNGDVRCPVSAEIWIAVGIACGLFLLLLILAVFFFLRRRRKQAEQRSGSKDVYTNGHSTMIPLEVIYEDKTMPKSSPKGKLNPEFIGDDDDDNDIYKSQLLLFLKQSHLIRPNIYPDDQDNKSDTSDYSRKNSRKVSAVSTASGKNQEDNDQPTVEVEPDHQPAGQTKEGEKVIPSTEL